MRIADFGLRISRSRLSFFQSAFRNPQSSQAVLTFFAAYEKHFVNISSFPFAPFMCSLHRSRCYQCECTKHRAVQQYYSCAAAAEGLEDDHERLQTHA